VSELFGPDDTPLGPKMSPDKVEWAIGEQALPPTPGTLEEWREFAIDQPQLPMMIYIWIATSVAMKKQDERIAELERVVRNQSATLERLSTQSPRS
jgi:hypothetical protein